MKEALEAGASPAIVRGRSPFIGNVKIKKMQRVFGL
jgi:hypothetical protein